MSLLLLTPEIKILNRKLTSGSKSFFCRKAVKFGLTKIDWSSPAAVIMVLLLKNTKNLMCIMWAGPLNRDRECPIAKPCPTCNHPEVPLFPQISLLGSPHYCFLIRHTTHTKRTATCIFLLLIVVGLLGMHTLKWQDIISWMNQNCEKDRAVARTFLGFTSGLNWELSPQGERTHTHTSSVSSSFRPEGIEGLSGSLTSYLNARRTGGLIIISSREKKASFTLWLFRKLTIDEVSWNCGRKQKES